MAHHVATAERLEHLAAALRESVESVSAASPSAELCATAAHVAGLVEAAGTMLGELGRFTGELEGFAWTAERIERGGEGDVRESRRR